jgi:hypothetical protein
VNVRGLPYRLDLDKCTRALAQLEVEGELDGIPGLADAIGVSISTVSRLFSGRLPSLRVVVQVLDKLHLTFDQVATRDEDQDERTALGPEVQ